MTDLEKVARMALEKVQEFKSRWWKVPPFGNKLNKAQREAITFAHVPVFELEEALRQALSNSVEQLAQQQEPVSIKSAAQKAGINLPETYIPTMDDAIAAGDSVLMNEQAALLRECRAALDSLIAQKPTLAGLLCGSTTLGNLKAELGAYRPQGVFGTSPQRKPWVGLTEEAIWLEYQTLWPFQPAEEPRLAADIAKFARAIEAKLKEKNIK